MSGYLVFGRLAEGVSPERAEAEIAVVARQGPEGPRPDQDLLRPQVVSFAAGMLGFPKGGLLAVPGFFLLPVVSFLVLAVACANVGTLILVRTKARASELSVRTALGAGRPRILSQLFTEALVMALLAAGAGLLAADLLVVHRLPWVESQLPYWVDLRVSPTTVLWGLALAVLSAAVVGLLPAVKATGRAVQRNLQDAAGSRSRGTLGKLSNVLITVDVALAVATVGTVVSVTAGLEITEEEVAVPANEYLAVHLVIPESEGPEAVAGQERQARLRATHREVVRRLEAEPQVRGVAVAALLPRMHHPDRRIELEGEDRPADFRGHEVKSTQVGVGFFEAFNRPILNGRGFDLADLNEDRSAVIVNATFVDRVLRGGSPLGRRLRYVSRPSEPGPWHEIVGVVGDLGMNHVKPTDDQGIYHPAAPGEIHPMRLAIHVGNDPLSFTPRLRALVNDVDATAMVVNPLPLDEVRSEDAEMIVWVRLGAALVTLILIALAASGIYTLMSFSVAARTREIGIRRALGAQRSRLAFNIARRSLGQLGAGILIGMPVAGLLIEALKYDMGWEPAHSTMSVALVLGVGIMVLIGSVACTVPLARALRIMPTEALREER